MLTVVYWVLIGFVVWAFYSSLRTETRQLEYSVAALVIWVLTFGVHKLLKRAKNHEQ